MSVSTCPQKCPPPPGPEVLGQAESEQPAALGGTVAAWPSSLWPRPGGGPLLFPLAGNPTRAFLLLSPRATSEPRWLTISARPLRAQHILR